MVQDGRIVASSWWPWFSLRERERRLGSSASMANRTSLRITACGKSAHPTWKALAMRRLRANQSVDEVKRIAPPLHSRTWDRYTLLAYGDMCDFTELAILACDNKLVWAQATSCTWRHEFFRTITTNELAHIVQSYWALLVSDHQAKKEKADEGNSSTRSDAGQSE